MVKRRSATSEQKAKPERKRALKASSEIKHYEIHRLFRISASQEYEFIGQG